MARFPAVAKRKIDDTDPEVRLWRGRIEAYQADFEKWEKRCEKILKRYRDERKTGEGSGSADDKTRRYNCLWANVQTLRPALYGQQPIAIVERRFLDRDPLARSAAIIWERAIKYEIDDSHLHRTLKKTVLDYLLVGRGVPWIRYEPQWDLAVSPGPSADSTGDIDGEDEETEPEETEPEDQDAAQAKADNLVSERCCIDYVHWKDFFHGQARTWEENDFVGRRLFMDEDELETRFTKEIADAIPMQHLPEGLRESSRKDAGDDNKKAEVFEIWSKRDKNVRFIATGYDKLLEEPREDPLKLRGFWPCPEPLYATLTNDTLVPVPDFIEYQDQAQEIDDLTNRISGLQKALKVAGVYDASATGLQRLLNEGNDNELIPVKGWAMFAEKGGLAAAISWLPIEQVVQTLLGLYEARDKIKVDLNEITGIADILRGQSDPNETLGAQRIKSNYGSLRLQDRQAEVARFCRDTINIMGEVIAEHFSDETLITSSGALYDEALMKPNPLLALLAPPTAPQGPGPPALPTSPPGGPAGMMAGGATGAPPVTGAPAMPPGAPPQGGPPPGQGPMGLRPVGPPPPINQETGLPYTQDEIDKLPKMVPDMDLIGRAIKFLRNDKLRGFRIDIEIDSTVQPSVDDEKEKRNEFLTSVSTFLETSMQVAVGMPDAIPMLGKMLQFGVRGYRVGRDLESTIDDFVDKAEKQAKAKSGQPPPPNPDLMKAQNDAKKTDADIALGQAKLQTDQASAGIDAQIKQKQLELQNLEMQHKQFEMASKQRETQMQQEGEVARAHIEAQNEASNRASEERMKAADYEMKQMELKIKELELHAKQREIDHKESMAVHEGQFKQLEYGAKQDEMGLKHREMEHKVDLAKGEVEHRQRVEKAPHETAAKFEEVSKTIGEHLKSMSRPRRIERDKTGRALRLVPEDDKPKSVMN